MRILYLSCHSILEYDEVKLFRELGHYVFSPGAYVEPRNPGDSTLRPSLDMDYDAEDLRLWHEIPAGDGRQKHNIPRSFVERFDVVIVMHMTDWIYENWDNLSARPVVWRTIGQSITSREDELRACRSKGLKIVRYSPMEVGIPGYIGGDAVIRFYKDPAEFSDWNGNIAKPLTINQSISHRGDACNYELWERVTVPFERVLAGPGNEGIRGSVGKVPFDNMKRLMQNHRAYFYVGTQPASYTLNMIEAMMTGIPIVAIGPKHGDSEQHFPGHRLYEPPKLITHGVNGFVSDDIYELQNIIRMLLDDHHLTRAVSSEGRQLAINHFGKDGIKEQWRGFLEALQ